MKLRRAELKDTKKWEDAGIKLPEFDVEKMIDATSKRPTWIHFGAGNIFRGFIAMLKQTLLNKGLTDTGIIAVESYDFEVYEKIYKPYDNLGLRVIMNADGTLEREVVGSIADIVIADPSNEAQWAKLNDIFKNPSLQIVSMTITEKGYNLKDFSGNFIKEVTEDIELGPERPKNVVSKLTSLVYSRYKAGEHPLALVSLDNFSGNGERLKNAVMTIAEEWNKKGYVEEGFIKYLDDPSKVSFPLTMIDKIVPRPHEIVKKSLENSGLEDMDIITTSKNTVIAPFVNAERAQYLVIEDKFPNGRMKLEEAGVILTDKETVEKVERMKVTTCLNPLHTALAIYGCLLNYKTIADEMKDGCLKKLVEKVGYVEGMPVVINPKVLDPEEFIKEVIEVRLPNPYMPDTPQRIATDTSQKMGIRFGETIKSYMQRSDLDVKSLKYIPLVIAGWCRYLMGIDDNGNEMALSPDPLLNDLKSHVSNIKLGDVESIKDNLKPILSNKQIFGLDLYEAGLGEMVENYFKELISGAGAVRNTLKKYLKC
ncbi:MULTISPECIES: mannitol dehydrogenase family protein [Thermoanaerobacterium]|uniref:Mannitol dehydrogenase domain-containing protein n=2 Tax=Thermoanaerobacterium TaxID=28895 RepID=W9EF61_9THEO|nr:MULTISPECIES: mannitol dehydrogenase family protein [Thermoanaerobacterium]AFK85189.1 Mannitol dehydrogenase domain-containing protein [Thermoanaerobacterium saccharolyticum JW/SL-YS485]ETO39635.1 Mannitol dehydrogenase domain-containing protein [Thermoanaerobacterium aotearoense SCUT27]